MTATTTSWNGFVFCTAKDNSDGKLYYYAANTKEQLKNHCLDNMLHIISYVTNPAPFIVTKHFEWVGDGKRPTIMQVSKPFNYEDPTFVPPEKW